MSDNQQADGDRFQAGDPEPLNKDQVTINHPSFFTTSHSCLIFSRLTMPSSSSKRSTQSRITQSTMRSHT